MEPLARGLGWSAMTVLRPAGSPGIQRAPAVAANQVPQEEGRWPHCLAHAGGPWFQERSLSFASNLLHVPGMPWPLRASFLYLDSE